MMLRGARPGARFPNGRPGFQASPRQSHSAAWPRALRLSSTWPWAPGATHDVAEGDGGTPRETEECRGWTPAVVVAGTAQACWAPLLTMTTKPARRLTFGESATTGAAGELAEGA